MPRHSTNARPKFYSTYVNRKSVLISKSNILNENSLVTSMEVVDRALKEIEKSTVKRQLGDLTASIIRLWGKVSAPEQATAYWKENNNSNAETYQIRFGNVLGWAVASYRSKEERGVPALPIFSMVRFQAGNLARKALVTASGNDAVYSKLSLSVPTGLTKFYDARYDSKPEPLDFRLNRYPKRGRFDYVSLNGLIYSIGYHPTNDSLQVSSEAIDDEELLVSRFDHPVRPRWFEPYYDLS